MRLIGVCGRSGSGKGVFCKIASENGIKIIDCDKVYKELVSKPSKCLSELAEAFGGEVIKDSALNRRYLAPIVFSDNKKLALLNSITYKHILSEIESLLALYKDEDMVLLDAPTLFESGFNGKCHEIIGIIADDETCVARIAARDNVSESEARLRLKNQLSESFLREHCDYVISNVSDMEQFKAESLKLINKIREVFCEKG